MGWDSCLTPLWFGWDGQDRVGQVGQDYGLDYPATHITFPLLCLAFITEKEK